MNAPKAGYITELLAEEEETVAVGQDLFKLEVGEAPAGGTFFPGLGFGLAHDVCYRSF